MVWGLLAHRYVLPIIGVTEEVHVGGVPVWGQVVVSSEVVTKNVIIFTMELMHNLATVTLTRFENVVLLWVRVSGPIYETPELKVSRFTASANCCSPRLFTPTSDRTWPSAWTKCSDRSDRVCTPGCFRTLFSSFDLDYGRIQQLPG